MVLGMAPLPSFNRTIVELKYFLVGGIGVNHRAFNRTIVELKFMQLAGQIAVIHTFNRTIVELKFLVNKNLVYLSALLTEP